MYSGGFGEKLSQRAQIDKYFDHITDTNSILDIIKIMFFFMNSAERVWREKYNGNELQFTFADALLDLNTRLRENHIGFELIDMDIVRVDSALLHKTITEPALVLLAETDYINAGEEFKKAQEHYRLKNNKECLNYCLNAFETTMKIVCAKNKWHYDTNDTAKKLIQILLTNEFLPAYNEEQLQALARQLIGTIPTARNKNSGHGQGEEKIVVPDQLARFILNSTGSTIRLVIETQKERSK